MDESGGEGPPVSDAVLDALMSQSVASLVHDRLELLRVDAGRMRDHVRVGEVCAQAWRAWEVLG